VGGAEYRDTQELLERQEFQVGAEYLVIVAREGTQLLMLYWARLIIVL